jgi:hypothetical protein
MLIKVNFQIFENKILSIDLCKEINDDWSGIWKLKFNEDPHKYFMKIQNIDQLKLLLKTSDRLHEDFEENSSSQEKLVLRKWIDHLSNEYRCFICHGKLNAVSGYQSIDNEQQMKDLLIRNHSKKLFYQFHIVMQLSIVQLIHGIMK